MRQEKNEGVFILRTILRQKDPFGGFRGMRFLSPLVEPGQRVGVLYRVRYSAGSLCLCIVAICSIAYANAGTPILFTETFPLIGANLIIGVFEGFLIAIVFKQQYKRSVAAMLLANGASALIGVFLLTRSYDTFFVPWEVFYLEGPLHDNVTPALLIFCAIAFFISLVVEYPFSMWIFRAKEDKALLGFKAAALAQVCSYLSIAIIVIIAGRRDRVGSFEIDHTVVKRADSGLSVLYLSGPVSKQTVLMGLDGSNRSNIGSRIFNPSTMLYFTPNEKGNYDVWGRKLGWGREAKEEHFLIEENAVSGRPPPYDTCERSVPSRSFPPREKRHRVVIDLRNSESPDWIIQQEDGFVAKHKSGRTLRIDKEPWYPRYITVISENSVVMGLGQQIGYLDLESAKIGIVARGVHPIIIQGRRSE